jgi:hypothetical protein
LVLHDPSLHLRRLRGWNGELKVRLGHGRRHLMGGSVAKSQHSVDSG